MIVLIFPCVNIEGLSEDFLSINWWVIAYCTWWRVKLSYRQIWVHVESTLYRVWAWRRWSRVVFKMGEGVKEGEEDGLFKLLVAFMRLDESEQIL